MTKIYDYQSYSEGTGGGVKKTFNLENYHGDTS